MMLTTLTAGVICHWYAMASICCAQYVYQLWNFCL